MACLAVHYLPTDRGPRFLASWSPAAAPRAAVLLVPPFAEELNKCRRMLALTARALAAAGWRVLLPDFGGTGDSAGEFGAARTADWGADLADVAAHAAATGTPVRALVGARLGAALALPLLARVPTVDRVVAWQPVVSGQQHLTQFLRLRVAASLTGAGAGVTVAGLRAALAGGETLEVGGYAVSPALAADLDALRFEPPASVSLPALDWLEVSAADVPVPGPLAAEHLRRWQARGAAATAGAVPGDPFWATVETTVAPALVARTVACIGSPPA